ncbi:DUF2620 family protein [Vibrio sp. 10N]|jgi:hypothetical protein|uniref:DUF2620 family protein n=1 Tax=unclassified Vibrio TaxID=2614977 RepID=UPI000DD9D947|nr:DUF2620 domain-containing protein [Vibrio sp. 10N]
MKKIAIAGLQREQIRQQILPFSDQFEVHILNDMEAASRVKSGDLDFYIGCCNTGAGAALSIAMAIIGFDKCCTIAKPSVQAKPDEVAGFVSDGKVAFGLSVEHVEHAIPILMSALSR